MTAVLGLDQGGSHTWAVAAGGDGSLLGLGRAEGGGHVSVGMEKAMAEVALAAREALRIACITPGDVDLILGGLTGADWPDEYGLLAEHIRGLNLARGVEVTNDSIIALRAGTDKPYGAILVAGTGGNVAVRSPRGEEFHFGYYHDMEYQGGGALARHAFNAIFRSHSFRGQPTLLADLFCAHFGLGSVDVLARAYFEGRLEDIPRLAPLIFEAGERGDPAAKAIVRAFGRGYAEMAGAALLRYGMEGLDVDVVLSGGVFKSPSRLLRKTILTGIRRVVPRAHLVDARYEPVVGAILLGLENLGVDTSAPVFRRRLDETARALGLVRQISV